MTKNISSEKIPSNLGMSGSKPGEQNPLLRHGPKLPHPEAPSGNTKGHTKLKHYASGGGSMRKK